jgi:transposase-like protein
VRLTLASSPNERSEPRVARCPLGYRLQLFDVAGRVGVSAACRTFGVHRSTYYRWKRQVDRHGIEVLRPRERRRPSMPNQLPAMVEE